MKNRCFLPQFLNKLGRIKVNHVLFYLINSDNSFYSPYDVLEIIKIVDSNHSIVNPHELLIKILNIDIEKIDFEDLVFTPEKIDYELFKKQLKNELNSVSPAKEITTKLLSKYLHNKKAFEILNQPLMNSIYDKYVDTIYIPVLDEIHEAVVKSLLKKKVVEEGWGYRILDDTIIADIVFKIVHEQER